MTNDEIVRAFLERGWEIRYRGGNSIWTTPSDLDLIVADAPIVTGDEGSPLRYSIAAWPSSENGPAEEQLYPIFDLYDAKLAVTARMRRVPTPKRASELLERYGVPESETRNSLGFTQPLVPREVE